MKIGFFEIEGWEKDYISGKLPGHELYFFDKGEIGGNGKEAEVEILSNFIGYPVSAETLKQFPNLKYVTTRSTGYDHIDLQACLERGIVVSNVPAYGENTVAEFTFALLLALSRNIFPAIKQVKEQALFSVENLRGFDLKDKILGIIGTGHIGTYVVKIARGFSMNVVAFDPYPKAELAREFGFQYLSLEDLLKTSDVISLHVPYLPTTHHLLNKNTLSLCKKGSVLINTARGGLVETDGLIWALKEGILKGAAMDVLEEEGFIKDELELLSSGHPNEQQLKTALADHELMHMDNVLITPHTAFNTTEAIMRILDTTISNIDNFVKGQPVNVVKG